MTVKPMLLPVHAVLEAYSVMTRIPRPLRMEPKAALAVIQSYVDFGELLSPGPAQYLEFLDSCAAAGVAGGRIYDAIIIESDRAANADVLLTYNLRDFAVVARGLELHVPGVM